MSELKIKDFIENYEAGKYNTFTDLAHNDCAGWYDWFCKDQALAGKTKKMYQLLKGIKNPFILENYRVWFKNNCPVGGPLYDDCRFEPIDESKRDELFFLVTFDCCWVNGKYSVATARNDYETEAEFETMKELRAWLSSWKG